MAGSRVEAALDGVIAGRGQQEPRETDMLTANDRCDADCGAQAWVVYAVGDHGGRLLFCAHHAARYDTQLEAAGGSVLYDNRSRLEALEAGR